jgi:predicted AlkP superfamily pyrophosphatase or phosphodiesterase
MTSLPTRLAALLAALLLAACAPSAREVREPVPAPEFPLLLVSIDGAHPGRLFRGDTPNLDALARRGTHAEGMRPSYPSLTFPNHYTLVTGLRPDRHGIVDNRMRDPELGGFSMQDRAAVGDGRWWDDGEPLWVTAQAHGLRSATMFWPGSEAAVRGVRPDRWYPFEHGLPEARRVATVLGWLDLPAAKRPHLMTLYFERVDTAGHVFGPDSAQARAALATVDAAIGELVAGLEARGLRERVNLVVVSDHGMAGIHPDRTVFVEDLLPAGAADVVHLGSQAGFNPRPGHEAALEAALLGRRGHVECWRREDIPARWAFGTHRRVPALYCQADTGWRIESRELRARSKSPPHLGAHGFDPADPRMQALFLADGPGLADAATLPVFDNVHLHPLLLELLGLPAMPQTDGDPAVLRPALSAGSP